jgi:hypothetical protein
MLPKLLELPILHSVGALCDSGLLRNMLHAREHLLQQVLWRCSNAGALACLTVVEAVL